MRLSFPWRSLPFPLSGVPSGLSEVHLPSEASLSLDTVSGVHPFLLSLNLNQQIKKHTNVLFSSLSISVTKHVIQLIERKTILCWIMSYPIAPGPTLIL